MEHFFGERGAMTRTLRAVVITGAGDRFFAAGGDVKRYRELRSREQLRAAFERPRRLLDDIEEFPRPVIAAVNGWALGGGAELMLACDLRVADENARIGFPYARLSLISGWYGAERLVAAVGQSAARNMLLRGQPVDAAAAQRHGPGARGGAGRGCGGPGLDDGRRVHPAGAPDHGRHQAGAAGHLPGVHQPARAVADREFEDLWVSDDHREGEAAFAEKRDAAVQGKLNEPRPCRLAQRVPAEPSAGRPERGGQRGPVSGPSLYPSKRSEEAILAAPCRDAQGSFRGISRGPGRGAGCVRCAAPYRRKRLQGTPFSTWRGLRHAGLIEIAAGRRASGTRAVPTCGPRRDTGSWQSCLNSFQCIFSG